MTRVDPRSERCPKCGCCGVHRVRFVPVRRWLIFSAYRKQEFVLVTCLDCRARFRLTPLDWKPTPATPKQIAAFEKTRLGQIIREAEERSWWKEWSK